MIVSRRFKDENVGRKVDKEIQNFEEEKEFRMRMTNRKRRNNKKRKVELYS